MASSLRAKSESSDRDHGPERPSGAYRRLEELLSREQCVILDGGIATQLEELHIPGYELRDDTMWGMWALLNAPEAVRSVHRSYVEVGSDVISTDTWGLQGAMSGEGGPGAMPSADWMDLARRGIRLAREAVGERGREGETAVAFSLHGDVADERGLERLDLLARVFEEEPPDLVLLETMSLVRTSPSARSRPCSRAGFPSGSASGAAATASAGSSASTGAAPRGTCSGERRGASRRWASAHY